MRGVRLEQSQVIELWEALGHRRDLLRAQNRPVGGVQAVMDVLMPFGKGPLYVGDSRFSTLTDDEVVVAQVAIDDDEANWTTPGDQEICRMIAAELQVEVDERGLIKDDDE